MTKACELVDEIERVQRLFDEANAANDDAAWEAARAHLVAWFAIHGGSKAILTALRSPSPTREAVLEEAAKRCDAKAERARGNSMFPAYCLNAVADTADELAAAIRALKLPNPEPIVGQSGETIEAAVFGARMVLEGKAANAAGCLADPKWRPDRAHIEGCRNAMYEALDYLRPFTPSIVDLRVGQSGESSHD